MKCIVVNAFFLLLTITIQDDASRFQHKDRNNAS